jgi:dTDP-4-amino-4,6-dideoxygalactose transaminase
MAFLGKMEKKRTVSDDAPIRETFLPYVRPEIGKDEISAVTKSLENGWLTSGPMVHEFEKRFSEYTQSANSIAVSSCTAALEISLKVAGVKKGTEVITTPLTFASTAHSILHLGGELVLADIDEETFNISPDEIRKKITDRTKAIIPVHFGGHPCDMDEIMAIAKEHGIPVIEDAAHAIGAEYKGKHAGTIGDFGCFSFYATKNLCTGEGGMIVTDDPGHAKRSVVLRLHGMSRDAWNRYSREGRWLYDIVDLGFKFNMMDMQAALGIEQLKKLDTFNEKRKRIAEKYIQTLKSYPGVRTQKTKGYIKHAWHLFPVWVDVKMLGTDRDSFIGAMVKENIGMSLHFIPVHLHTYYRKRYGFRRGDFPVSERIFDGFMAFPIYPSLTDKDVEDVLAAFDKVYNRFKDMKSQDTR